MRAALPLALALLAASAAGQAPRGGRQALPQPQQLWTIQLPGDIAAVRKRASEQGDCAGLLFTQEGLLLDYLVQPVAPRLVERSAGAEPGTAFEIRLTLRSPGTGTKLASAAWPTTVGHGMRRGYLENAVLRTRGGILLQAMAKLHVLTDGLVETKVWELPERESLNDPVPWAHAELLISPDRSEILLDLLDLDDTAHHRICTIDGGTFERRPCYDREAPPYAVAGGTGVFSGREHSYLVSSLDGTKSRTLPMPADGVFDSMVDAGHFLLNCCGKARRETIMLGSFDAPPVVLYAPSSKDEETGLPPDPKPLQISDDTRLVARRSALVHRGSSWLDTFDKDLKYRVLLLDLQKKGVYAATPWVKTPKYIYDFALSPDGRYLAVMADRKVTMYRLSP